MRQVYVKHISKKYAVAGDAYIEDDPIPPGKVITYHRAAAYFAELTSSEYINWYIKNGGQRLWIGDDKPGTTGGPAQRDLQLTLGEGMSLGCYSANITTDEVFHFVATGCLSDLESWRMIVGD